MPGPASAPSAGAAILHVAPHPDDELIGAPATLLALRDAGHPIINLACSLGRRDDQQRRRAELTEACRRARFELLIPERLFPDSGNRAELQEAERELAALITSLLASRTCAYVVGPSPHDAHPAHEAVGRAIRDALAQTPQPPPWGMWGLWSDLPLPNIYLPFDATVLAEILEALSAHAGELERNDYATLVESRARMNAVLGSERVFGFGAAGRGAEYAELLTEVVFNGRGWERTPAAEWPQLDPPPGAGKPVDAWLNRASDRDTLGG
jgi:LmbE family N-acetylglucosaminyl deacetylase